MRQSKIEYNQRFVTDEKTGEIVSTTSFKWIINTYVKIHGSSLYYIGGLPQCPRDLIDFLSQEMNEDNIVSSNIVVRQKFIDLMKYVSNGETIYGHDSVVKAFNTLWKRKAIRKCSRGVYKVNPEIFYRGDNDYRLKMIKTELETE